VVPGGSANVFARALGISPDPTVATNQLIDLLGEHGRNGSWRRIGLMDCGERWAVFTAGMGVDGDVVAAVEAQRAKGRKVTARPLHPGGGEGDAGQRPPGADPDAGTGRTRTGLPGGRFAFISNSSPWTYSHGFGRCSPIRTPRSEKGSACSRSPA
jgi:hypothetical protein